MVSDGVTLIDSVFILPGIQVYVAAPLPKIAALSPLQILAGNGNKEIVGVGFTVTSTVSVLVQPAFEPLKV